MDMALIVFWLLALSILAAAWAVVTGSDIVHSLKYRLSKYNQLILELHRCCDAHADAHTAIPDKLQQ